MLVNKRDNNRFSFWGNLALCLACYGGVGILCGVIYEFVEDKHFAGMIILVILAATFAFLGGIVANQIITPVFERRQAALRIMGKRGMSEIRHDESAELAFKGLYNLLKCDYLKAESCLNLAMTRADVTHNRLLCLGWLMDLYEAADNRPKLMWCFRKAVEIAPEDADAQSRLGHAYYVNGNLDNAMYCFQQALRYDPNNGYSYYSMAKIQILRGEDKKAEETLNTLLKINENHPLVYAELATIAAMRGDKEKSREYFEKASLCGLDDPESLNKRLTAIMNFGQVKDVTAENLPGEYYRRIEKQGQDNDTKAV